MSLGLRRVGEVHLLVGWRRWSWSLEREHQAVQFEVDHQIQVVQLDLEDPILVFLLVRRMVDLQGQNVEDPQVQNEEDHHGEDLLVQSVVGHQVLSVEDLQVQDNCLDPLEVDSHWEDHLVENCSEVLVDTHRLVGSCSGWVGIVH